MIFKDPAADADDPEAGWQTADEYLSGNVRDKLRMAQLAAESHPEFKVNVEALDKAQPKDLEASEIDVRLGATWLAPSIVQQFMMETFQPPYRIRYNNAITVRYSPYTSEWRISNKSATGFGDIMATETYGTRRANAYKILEDTLNLRDSRVYDTIEEDGKEKRVLNQNETTLAQQKQQAIKDAFAGWVWKDPQRRALLVKKYNELFNTTRPREYDGSHIHFVGMNPEIDLREHQRNAVAHVLPVPDAKFETVVVKPSEIQQDMVQALSERAAEVHSGSVAPSVDNMLKITSDGRKIGLDQRLMNSALPDDPSSKLNACVNNVLRIWNDTKEQKLTQLIFCDMSTPRVTARSTSMMIFAPSCSTPVCPNRRSSSSTTQIRRTRKQNFSPRCAADRCVCCWAALQKWEQVQMSRRFS